VGPALQAVVAVAVADRPPPGSNPAARAARGGPTPERRQSGLLKHARNADILRPMSGPSQASCSDIDVAVPALLDCDRVRPPWRSASTFSRRCRHSCDHQGAGRIASDRTWATTDPNLDREANSLTTTRRSHVPCLEDHGIAGTKRGNRRPVYRHRRMRKPVEHMHALAGVASAGRLGPLVWPRARRR
jgi:hypothetical protein